MKSEPTENQSPTKEVTLKPATPQTEQTPSPQLRRAGFGSPLLLLLALAGPVLGYEIPTGGSDLTSSQMRDWKFEAHATAQATGKLVEVTGQSFTNAWQITVGNESVLPNAVTLQGDLQGAIKQNDTLLLSFYMRALRSENESGTVKARIHIRQNSAPQQTAGTALTEVGAAWQLLTFPLKATQALAPGEGNVSVQFGNAVQSLEIAAIRVVNYGPDRKLSELAQTKEHYEGQNLNASWRGPAAERIAKIRKADLHIRVTDDKGMPLTGAEVSVAMKRHAFGFGSAVFPETYTMAGPDGERYRDFIHTHFNKAPIGMGLRWENWYGPKPSELPGMFDRLNATIDGLRAFNIEVRGHYLLWAPMGPQPAKLLKDKDAFRDALFAHIREKSAFTANRIGEWDAVNHIVAGVKNTSELCGKQLFADVIKLGHDLNPHAEMWINEGQVLPSGRRREPYFEMVKYLLDQKAPLDGLGFMGHFTSGSLTGIDELYGVYERFGKLGLPLQLTEFDVDVGTDEQLQADYLRDVLTLSFSHPSFEAVVMWGFWEGRHWKPNASLWRRDWTIKPAGQVWMDLVFKQWWTDAKGTTDAAGSYQVNGFLGDYEITVKYKDKQKTVKATLPHAGLELSIIP